jgi:hypothetical protein
MQLTSERNKKSGRYSNLLVLSLALALAGCDVLESDQKSSESELRLKDGALYITPGSPGIIDLHSLIENGSDARLAVASLPRFGTLRSVGGDLLQYTPNQSILEGRDGFAVSIFGENNMLVNEDSVVIIITRDSTALPCGLYAMTDYVYNITSSVDIPVLANDTACNVSPSQLEVSIPNLVIDGVAVPQSYFGSLQVLADGRIRYTPGTTFGGADKFVYQVVKPENIPNAGDPELTAFGFVYITQQGNCADSLAIFNDVFTFDKDSLAGGAGADSVYLNVTGNDLFCTQASNDFSFSLSQFPDFGEVSYGVNYGFTYLFPSSAAAGFVDRFRYRVCVDGVCQEAEVIIRLE